MVNLKQKEVLVLITGEFPYGKKETYLETEIKFLCHRFDQILIVSHSSNFDSLRDTPKKVKIVKLKYSMNIFHKIISVRQIFTELFWKEVVVIKNNYKLPLSIGVLKTLLFSIENGKRLSYLYSIILKKINSKLTLYSYWGSDCAISLAMMKLKKKIVFKGITRLHRWDIYFEENKYEYLPLRNFIFQNLDGVFFISEDGINYTKKLVSKNYASFKISRLGIIKSYEFNKINNKDFILVSCSSIIKVKRVKLIAEAILYSGIKKLTWVHFGGGELYNEVKEYCDEFLKNKFVFAGQVENSEVMEFYSKNNHSIFINLSSSEGLPVSIMEAMSFAIPVIATNVGGNSEIVSNKNGYLLKSNPTAIDVSEKIRAFWDLTTAEKNNKRKEAYKTWNENFSAEKNYDKFITEISLK